MMTLMSRFDEEEGYEVQEESDDDDGAEAEEDSRLASKLARLKLIRTRFYRTKLMDFGHNDKSQKCTRPCDCY